MKKYLVFALWISLTMALNAQIDRSKQPVPGPAPKINLSEPDTFQLQNGLKVLVVENNKLPRVRIQLDIDNPPVLEGEKAGVSSLMSSLLGNGSTTIPKDEFNEEIDFLGANIAFGANYGFASCLSKYFPRILTLMADAAINPNFTQEEFDKEKEKALTGLKAQEKDVSAIATRVQLALTYGKNNPNGEYTTETTLNNITLSDIQQYYRKHFVPANAYLIVVGDVVFEDVQELITEAFTPWTKAVPPSFSYGKPSDVQYPQINFVDVPNAVQSEVSVQNLTELRMKDSDYLPALIANQILGGGGEGRLFLNLREDKGYTYGSYSAIRDNKYGPIRFNAYAQVRNKVTDSAAVEILKEIDKIRSQPVTAQELENTKNKYAGRFVRALENPETVARYALNIAQEGLPSNFYKNYLERLDAITIEQVQEAAEKHFSVANSRVVIVGKGKDVIENLEKVTFKGKSLPVLYFDQFANKTTKPDFSVLAPEGVSANAVLTNYLEAIGGQKKIAAINSLSLKALATVQDQPMELIVKKSDGDKYLKEIKMLGSSIQKEVFNNDNGYLVTMGQKKELSSEDINAMKNEAAAIPEFYYLKDKTISLKGIEKVAGQEAYVLQLAPNKTAYYNVETGLKLKEVSMQEFQGQSLSTTLTFMDYEKVSGILFPSKMKQTAGTMNFIFEVEKIIVNEDISNDEFQ
ncbi:MAG: insulinase family protein [Bacteroidota bacterium]